jgi:hypothetical protein
LASFEAVYDSDYSYALLFNFKAHSVHADNLILTSPIY